LIHPNIVRILRNGDIGEHRYFAFEHVDGVDGR